MLDNYKQFIASRNVLDWAIGIVLGTSFAKIVDSFVADIMWPPVSTLLGKVNFQDLFIDLSGHHYQTLSQAKSAGAATVNYGLFTNSVLDFMVDSVVVYLAVQTLHRVNIGKNGNGPLQECPECTTMISARAKRCPHCTAQIVHT